MDFLIPNRRWEIYLDKPILHSEHHDNTERQTPSLGHEFLDQNLVFRVVPIKIDVYHLSLPTVTIIYNCITVVLLRR